MAEAKSFAEDLELGNDEPVEQVVEGEAKPSQPRDEHGKFVKGEEEGAPPAPAEKQEFDGAATLAERRKRQEVEAELAALRTQIQQQQNPPPAPPDIWEDPEGRLATEREQLQRQFQQELWQNRLMTSHNFAVLKHGEEAVAEAMKWATERELQDDQFRVSALSQMDPVGFAIEMHRREKMASISAEDFAAFNQWREQQANPPQAQPAKLPPTLTGERSLGRREGPVSTGPTTFGEILNR